MEGEAMGVPWYQRHTEASTVTSSTGLRLTGSGRSGGWGMMRREGGAPKPE